MPKYLYLRIEPKIENVENEGTLNNGDIVKFLGEMTKPESNDAFKNKDCSLAPWIKVKVVKCRNKNWRGNTGWIHQCAIE